MTTRRALFEALNVVKTGPDMDAIVDRAYNLEADREWREMNQAPHGSPWHTSFHGSQFPGGENEKRCARQALYVLMDIPTATPANVKLVATGGVGKAVERQIVWRWARQGILLTGDPKEPYAVAGLHEWTHMKQLGIEDEDTWLTGSIDAALDARPGWEEALIIDVKTKPLTYVEEMRVGLKTYEPDHYKQVQSYLYLVHKAWDLLGWEEMGLKKPTGGVILYVARDNPSIRRQFWVPMDEEFIAAGIERLLEWRQHFLAANLPERPKEWKWTEHPCKWCNFKRQCKADVKEGVTNLLESNAVSFAQTINSNYDPEKIIGEVIDRWNKTPLPQS